MSNDKTECPDCFGWGYTLKDCSECGGSGRGVDYTSPNCMECNGTGVIEKPCENPRCKGNQRASREAEDED